MIALPSQLTQAQANDCLRALTDQLRVPTGPQVSLDAAALERFDSSALAVVLECRRLVLAQGRVFSVNGMPARLEQLARLYGVSELLAPPAADPVAAPVA